MDDLRFGKRGISNPVVCAISGNALKKPWVTHSLGGEYFCRVIAKYDRLWSEKVESQLKAAIVSGKHQPVTVEQDKSK